MILFVGGPAADITMHLPVVPQFVRLTPGPLSGQWYVLSDGHSLATSDVHVYARLGVPTLGEFNAPPGVASHQRLRWWGAYVMLERQPDHAHTLTGDAWQAWCASQGRTS